MYLVFTYGTLMRGNCNHHYMDGSEFVCEATLSDYAIYELGWYPGIKRKEGGIVRGEIYKVLESNIAAIRRLEGEGTLYKEIAVSCQSEGKEVNCVAYVYLPEVSEEQRIDGNKPWKAMY